MLHYTLRPGGDSGSRLGLVVAKKLVKSAVRRNLIRRLARERFRCRRDKLGNCDLVLRLQLKPETLNRSKIAAEIDSLLDKLQARMMRAAKDAGIW